MNETPKDLTNLGLLLKEKMKLVKHETKQMNELKKEIREIMVKNDLKAFKDPEHNLEIKCNRSFSFDLGMFKYSEPELSLKYIVEETKTITTTEDIFDKKLLQKTHPEVYEKYLIENTTRLSVK